MNKSILGAVSLFAILVIGSTPVTAQSPAPGSVPSMTVQAATNIGSTVATLNGTIVSTGGSKVVERGFNYGLTTSYGQNTFNIDSTGLGYNTGSYPLTVSGLTCGTIYHYRAYARNTTGTGYSTDSVFTTGPCTSPTASPSPAATPAASDTTPPTAFPLTSSGGTYITSAQDITITAPASDNVAVNYVLFYVDGTWVYTDSTYPYSLVWTADSSKNGNHTFNSRVYDTSGNSATSPILTVTVAIPTASPSPAASPSATPLPVPSLTVQTPTPGSITMTAATLRGEITSTGGQTVTQRGFNYGLTTSYGKTKAATGTYGTGPYNWNIADYFGCGTTYHYRAFAKNASGTGYSPDMAFTTAECPPQIIPVLGWAWSSNIGWISLSSDNTDSNISKSKSASDMATDLGLWKMANAAGGPYGVTMSTSTSNPNLALLSGYAWSSNIGWIKFGGLAGYTISSGITTKDAQVVLNPGSPEDGKVSGWARACAGTATGDCSTMNPRTDGWDGWIELSGTNHVSPDPATPPPAAPPTASPSPAASPTAPNVRMSNQGVFLDTYYGLFSGYAWGSDVVGWVKFNPNIPITAGQGVHGGNCSNYGTCPTPTTATNPRVFCTGESSTAGQITYTAHPVGTGSYEYSWNSSAWSATALTFSDGVTYPYGANSAAPSLRARLVGTTAPVANSDPACPSVTSDNLSGAVKLKIGRMSGSLYDADTEQDALRVRQGTKFKLEWTKPADFKCDPIVPSGGGSDWENLWVITDSTNVVNDLDTNKTGKFEFEIRCSKKTDGSVGDNNSAWLRVLNVSEGEI